MVREVLDDAARERLVDNIVGHLLNGVSEPVLERAFEYWRNVDKDLGDRVEAGVRAKQDEKDPKADEQANPARSSRTRPDRACRPRPDRSHADQCGRSTVGGGLARRFDRSWMSWSTVVGSDVPALVACGHVGGVHDDGGLRLAGQRWCDGLASSDIARSRGQRDVARVGWEAGGDGESRRRSG